MDELVQKLTIGSHPVEVGLRPERTASAFKMALDRGYVHIKFLDTRGGTELGVRVNPEATDLSRASFDEGTGAVHVSGTLTLNSVRVECSADVDLSTLAGTGHLKLTA